MQAFAAGDIGARAADVLERRNLGDQLYEILEERIVSGTLPPGSRLSEEAIATEFGISRSPVRDVLAKLDSTGFAERAGLRDRRIAIPTEKFVCDTYETWIILELARVYLSSEAAKAPDHQQIRTHLSLMTQTWKAGRVDAYVKLANQLPDLLRHRCDNHQLLGVLHNFEKYRRWLVALYLRDERPSPTSLAEHKAVANYYMKRDLIGLKESITVHILQQRDSVLKKLRDSGPKLVAVPIPLR
jgi:GntR family transcriptional regulator, rspAB operon transcriptional repressor